KLLEDLQIISKELAEYINSPSWDRPIFFNDNEDHYVQYNEYLENPSNEIAVSNSNQEKEKPLQDFDIRQLIREECCTKDYREQKKNTEDTMLELVEVCRQKEFYCMHDNVDDLIESALNSKLLSINLDSQYKIIKSGVEEFVQIPNECEVTSEDKRECDVHVCEDSSTFDVCKDHSEILSDSNNDDISSDDDAFEDIEYVEASPLDSELVSLEEENVEEEEFNLEDIQDVILHEKLLSINRLIADIESLNDNPTPDCVLKSSALFPIFKESDNSLPEFETFSDHTEETRSGNTTTHANNSLPEYDSFRFEIESGQERLTSVIMNDISDDSTNDPLLEEVDLFLASYNLITPGEVITAIMNNIDELNKDECFDSGREINVLANVEDDDYFPFIFVIRNFLPYLVYPEVSLLLLSAESEDTIFDPGISV
nr:hypothetical protein [Tanacetum cinerariifolium]